MLGRLVLHNFLSYKHSELDLSAVRITSVVGENGHGKSALLEAILYALYGEGRTEVKRLVSLGDSPDMYVDLTLQKEGVGTIQLQRGRKPSGSGFLEVHVNGKVAAVGSKGQGYVDELLGKDAATFLLTDFFGVGATDTLMKVAPSQRLETLQRAAKVHRCSEIKALSDKKLRTVDADLTSLEGVLLGMQSTEPAEKFSKEKTELEAALRATRGKLTTLHRQRTQLAGEDDRLRQLAQEKSALEATQRTYQQQMKKHHASLELLQSSSAGAKEQRRRLHDEMKGIKELLADLGDVKEVRKKHEDVLREVSTVDGNIKLRQHASRLDNTQHKCPLCHADVSTSQLSIWKSELEKFGIRREVLDKQRVELVDMIGRIGDQQLELNKLQKSDAVHERDLEDCNNRQLRLQKEIDTLRGKMSGIDLRYHKLTGELQQLRRVSDEINDVDERVGKLQGRLGSLQERLEAVKQNEHRAIDARKRVDEVEGKMKKLKQTRCAWAAVSEAFGRYGIPLRLTKNLNVMIGQLATKVYHYFNDGELVVEEIEERGRPGIEFVLRDSIGERTYDMLSEGERVMMFVAIRVAVAKILSSTVGTGSDFLVLDEVTGHLSPTRRDDLVRLINKILRKLFKQVLMVSHTELPEIFNSTIRVEKVNDVSSAVVE